MVFCQQEKKKKCEKKGRDKRKVNVETAVLQDFAFRASVPEL